jgi:hypothetical protein
MNTPRVMMVQIASRAWTLEALHCACLIARNTGDTIALVKMVPVYHHSWLGTEWGYMSLNRQEQKDIRDYQATIEDYGLPHILSVFQYNTWVEATAQAAQQNRADRVFAQPPTSWLPGWDKVRAWSLQRLLNRQGCEWIQQPSYGAIAETPVEAHSLQ